MGLVAWMLIVMMMGAGIGRNSNTLELRGARRILLRILIATNAPPGAGNIRIEI